MKHLENYENFSDKIMESYTDEPDLGRFNASMIKAIKALKEGNIEKFKDFYMDGVKPYLSTKWAEENKETLKIYEDKLEEARKMLTPAQRIEVIKAVEPELMKQIERSPELMRSFGFYD